MKKQSIAILGAGSWGSAVAIHLAKAGQSVLLWSHQAQQISQMAQERCNARYLPGIPFPSTLNLLANLQDCLQQAQTIIIAVPSHAFAGLLQQIEQPIAGLAWLTKGLDPQSHKFLSELVAERFGKTLPVAVISGPSFAKEVAEGLPTALALASNNNSYQQELQQQLHQGNLRVYLTHDLLGIQLCGAVKNVLAIACGISNGLNYGANARAALVTRGLAEMTRLGQVLGAKPETFTGLAGVGDLVLTCTDQQSRNLRFGMKLGQNIAIAEAERQIGQVVEGKHNALQVCAIAQKHGIEMPICEQVHAILQGKTNARQAVNDLMNRPMREE